jgi:septal ring-binding cell division protein DamX
MQNYDENKLRPEESSSGFGPKDYSGSIFGGSAQHSEEGPNKSKTGTIDSDIGSHVPPKKNNTWKWMFSFFIIFLLLAVGTFLFLKNFINSPGFLNGTAGKDEKEITIRVEADDSGSDINVDISPDFGFDTDSIVNAMLAKSNNAASFNEVITKEDNGNTYYLNVNKQENVITLESKVHTEDGKTQKFVRRIVVSDDMGNNSQPPQQVQPEPKIQPEVNKENMTIEKKFIKVQTDNKKVFPQKEETKKVIIAENKTVPEVQLTPKEQIVPEPDKSKQYNFEKKFGKGKSKENIATNDLKPVPDNSVQDRQYASATPIYTIQVYSTPNLDDAKYWVSRLQQMNISTAYISKQKVRDITWYRVRFGEYPSKEEARSAASKFGFSQLWIDRVK